MVGEPQEAERCLPSVSRQLRGSGRRLRGSVAPAAERFSLGALAKQPRELYRAAARLAAKRVRRLAPTPEASGLKRLHSLPCETDLMPERMSGAP